MHSATAKWISAISIQQSSFSRSGLNGRSPRLQGADPIRSVQIIGDLDGTRTAASAIDPRTDEKVVLFNRLWLRQFGCHAAEEIGKIGNLSHRTK